MDIKQSKERIVVYLSPDIARKLRVIATLQRRSISNVVETILSEPVQKAASQAVQNLLEEVK
jgi:hypothetical protein